MEIRDKSYNFCKVHTREYQNDHESGAEVDLMKPEIGATQDLMI